MPADSAFTISYDVDNHILNDFEGELDMLRRCIASLSADTCDSMVTMFDTLSPAELALIDIDAIEEPKHLVAV